MDVTRNIASGKITMMLVSNEVTFAQQAAHGVVLLTEGEVVEEATPGAFFFNPSLERTRRFLEQIR